MRVASTKVCLFCNSNGIRQQLLFGGEFFYCRTCKIEIGVETPKNLPQVYEWLEIMAPLKKGDKLKRKPWEKNTENQMTDNKEYDVIDVLNDKPLVKSDEGIHVYRSKKKFWVRAIKSLQGRPSVQA